MTEIDNTVKSSLASNATDGLVVARVDVTASMGLSLNDAKAAGRASLIVVSSRDIHTSAVHRSLKLGGHSTKIVRGGFLKLVPVDGRIDNTLQEMPDGTSIHIAEENDAPDMLTNAPKPALVQPNPATSLSRREISRRFVMNVFSTSEEPEKYGLKDLIEDDLVKEVKNLDKAA